MAEPTAADLRQQYRSKLDASLAQGRELLGRYQQAYPDLSQIDWPAAQTALATNPMYGVNIHGRPTDLSPAWIQEQTIEPLEFGSLADPVSQLAFLAAPGLLRAGKATLETIGAPGPSRLSGLAGERGNLGPVPRGQRGEPLPESAVRGPQGELKRLYHGTGRQYPDFAAEKFSSGAGGDLYGPGIYMTEDPAIAEGYSTVNWPEGARDVYQQLHKVQEAKRYYQHRFNSARQRALEVSPQSQEWQALRDEALGARDALQDHGEIEQDLVYRMQRFMAQEPSMFTEGGAGANIRPVYADLKRPFDIEAPMTLEQAQALVPPGEDPALLARYSNQDWTGEKVYKYLEGRLKDKAAVNQWLQQSGYDGITHMGGGGSHQVYIAFSPDTVYPSVNVEGTP